MTKVDYEMVQVGSAYNVDVCGVNCNFLSRKIYIVLCICYFFVMF